MYWTQLWRNISFSHRFSFSSSVIVAASRMLTYLQTLQWCSVQNREINFYKGFFRKKKRNIKYLSIKKRKHHLLSMVFLNNALMLTFFHHTASLHAFTTLRNPWHLHISDTAYSVTLFFNLSPQQALRKYDYSATCIGLRCQICFVLVLMQTNCELFPSHLLIFLTFLEGTVVICCYINKLELNCFLFSFLLSFDDLQVQLHYFSCHS